MHIQLEQYKKCCRFNLIAVLSECIYYNTNISNTCNISYSAVWVYTRIFGQVLTRLLNSTMN